MPLKMPQKMSAHFLSKSVIYVQVIHKLSSMKDLSFSPSSVIEELPTKGILYPSNAELDTY